MLVQLQENPSSSALTLIFLALHACTLHWYIRHFTMDILGQEYERFMMLLEDLKLFIQEIMIEQDIEAIK